MLNVVSILFGLLALVIVIPSQIPFLGIGNWLALPLLAAGIVIGQLSSKNTGRNLNLVILAIAVVRLMLGGGIF